MKSVRKSTVHNPVNFEPSDYTILGYFDNVPPEAGPMTDWSDPHSVNAFKAMRENWNREFEDLFPKGNAFKCQHCGQGNVRYVVSALHKTTGEHVCFGDICCERLGFENHDAFKAKMIRSRAQAASKRLALEASQAKFIADNHSFAEAYAELKANPEKHSCNSFANDVANKFMTYGSLSEKQVTSFVSSIARDLKYLADKADEAKEAPAAEFKTGKITLRGTIVSIKTDYGQWGACTKMLVKLDDGNKVWGSIPSDISYDAERGDTVAFVATVVKSDSDDHFGFFKRPTKARIENKVEKAL
jgi:hypothetical protein